MLVGRRRRLRLGRRDLGAESFDLSFELVPVDELVLHPLAGQLALLQRSLQLLDLRRRRCRRWARLGQRTRGEGQIARWLRLPVGTGEPVGELEQVRHRRDRVVLAERPGVVRRPVPQADRLLGHPEHRVAELVPEGRLVQQRAHALVVRGRQRAVVGVRPLDRLLDRPPSVEARRTRIPQRRRPRHHRTPMQIREVDAQELERRAHNSPRKARCWSEAKSPSSAATRAANGRSLLADLSYPLDECPLLAGRWNRYWDSPHVADIDATNSRPLCIPAHPLLAVAKPKPFEYERRFRTANSDPRRVLRDVRSVKFCRHESQTTDVSANREEQIAGSESRTSILVVDLDRSTTSRSVFDASVSHVNDANVGSTVRKIRARLQDAVPNRAVRIDRARRVRRRGDRTSSLSGSPNMSRKTDSGRESRRASDVRRFHPSSSA